MASEINYRQGTSPETESHVSSTDIVRKILDLFQNVKKQCDEQQKRTENVQNDLTSIKEMLQRFVGSDPEEPEVAPSPTPIALFVPKEEPQFPDSTDNSDDLQNTGFSPHLPHTSVVNESVESVSDHNNLLGESNAENPGPSNGQSLENVGHELVLQCNENANSNGTDDFIDELLDISNVEGYIPPTQPIPASQTPVRKDLQNIPHKMDESKLPEFVCVCDKKCSTQPHLNNHIARYTTPWKFCCPLCDQLFPGANEMRSHLKNSHIAYMTGYQSVGCTRCGCLFSSQKELVCHQNKSCDEDAKPSEVLIHGMVPNSQSQCYCGDCFETEEEFQKHFSDSTAECNVECKTQNCGKCFISKMELLEHMEKAHGQRSLLSHFRKRPSFMSNERDQPKKSSNQIGESNNSEPQPGTSTSTLAASLPSQDQNDERLSDLPSRSNANIPFPVCRVKKNMENKM